jgi:hypothetical protein
MATMEKSIEVNVPVRTAYNQWTQFEEFPRFMEGVREVQQLDDRRLHWHAVIGGKEKHWDAEIVEQEPDRRLIWRSTSGAENAGAVGFESLGGDRTRVTLRLDYDPEGAVENVGDALGLVSARVEGDLRRFKQFIESRGAETGAWRGEIHGGQVDPGAERAVGGSGMEGAAGAPMPGDAGAGMGTGMERELGGGLGSAYGRDRNNALAGTAGVEGTMSGSGANQGRADTGQAASSYPNLAGQGDLSIEEKGGGSGTTGQSGTSDAGGGSGTAGGLTHGVAGKDLPDDRQMDEKLRRERYDTTGGKASQRDSNIKTEE